MTHQSAPAGMQQERTVLAWRRTTLSFAVVGLFVARVSLEGSAPVLGVLSAGAVVAAVWIALMLLRRTRWRSPSEAEPAFEQMLLDGRLPAMVALLAASLCLTVGVLALGF